MPSKQLYPPANELQTTRGDDSESASDRHYRADPPLSNPKADTPTLAMIYLIISLYDSRNLSHISMNTATKLARSPASSVLEGLQCHTCEWSCQQCNTVAISNRRSSERSKSKTKDWCNLQCAWVYAHPVIVKKVKGYWKCDSYKKGWVRRTSMHRR